jgi:protein phosphatase 1 regulatory subunit 42
MEIGCMTKLQQLFASNNQIASIKELKQLIIGWHFLWKLDLSNNPICNKSKYRERIIVMAPNLEVLDAKEINDMSRQFLKNWKASKETYQSSKQLSLENL